MTIKNLGKSAWTYVALGIGTLATMFGNPVIAQAAARKGENCIIVDEKKIEEYQKAYQSRLKDPNNFLRLLREGEYVVPDKVLHAYIDDNTVGIYLLPSQNMREPFESCKSDSLEEKLRDLGFKDEEIALYRALEFRGDTILIGKSRLDHNGKRFKRTLMHERIHQEIAKLDEESQMLLYNAFSELFNKTYNIEEMQQKGIELYPDLERKEIRRGEINLVKDNENDGNFYMNCILDSGWGEFYTYLAEGKFFPRVEKALEKERPMEYKLFIELKENAEN